MTRLPRKAVERTAATAVIVLLCLGFALWEPRGARPYIDHAINRDAVTLMGDGQGYYEAMDRSLRAHIGPAETARAYRTPTLFLLWSQLPEGALWPLYTLMAGVVGVLVLGLTRMTVLAPVVVLYLLRVPRLGGDPPVDRFLLVEYWTVPLIAACLVAWRHRRWWPAAAAALAATMTRELAAVLLVGGLLAALRRRLPVAPWLVALAGAAAALIGHAVAASGHLVENGTENPLFLTGSLWTVLEFMGFGLPGGAIVGPPLWGLAAWRIFRVGDFDDLVILFLTMPFLGLLFDRSGWGVLLVPFTIVWAAEGLRLLVGGREAVTA